MPEAQTRAMAAAERLTRTTEDILAEVQQLPAELIHWIPAEGVLDGHGQPLSHPPCSVGVSRPHRPPGRCTMRSAFPGTNSRMSATTSASRCAEVCS